MAEVTEKDLEQKRSRIARMREQIATEVDKASSVTQAQNNAVEMATLEAEEARLAAQLAAAKEQAKVSNIRGGSEELVTTLREAVEAAKEVTPPGVLIDTNADEQPTGTTGATAAVPDGVAVTNPADGSVEVVAPDKKDGNS